MTTFYYGISSIQEAKDLTREVVDGLGGGEPVYCQVLEIACAETHCGTYPDKHPKKWGVGLCQFDKIALQDIQLEGEQRHFELVKKLWGYDIQKVELEDLADDARLSLICCRLKLKRIAEAIPDNLLDRAHYWKKYYNTEAGAGTVEHYLGSVKTCLGDEWQ